MKKSALFSSGFGMLALLLAGIASAQVEQSDETCSLESLKGSYTYWTQGYIEGRPYASGGIMSFDGTGKVALIYSRSVERAQQTTKGTYSVDPDCSGSMSLETGTINNVYLGPTGEGFTFVRVSGDSVVSGQATRVTTGQLVKPPAATT